jgi:hypothetical protein
MMLSPLIVVFLCVFGPGHRKAYEETRIESMRRF